MRPELPPRNKSRSTATNGSRHRVMCSAVKTGGSGSSMPSSANRISVCNCLPPRTASNTPPAQAILEQAGDNSNHDRERGDDDAHDRGALVPTFHQVVELEE